MVIQHPVSLFFLFCALLFLHHNRSPVRCPQFSPHKKDGKILYKKDPKIFTFSFISTRPSFCARPYLLCYRHTPDKKGSILTTQPDWPPKIVPWEGRERIYARWNTASRDRQKCPPPPQHNTQLIPPLESQPLAWRPLDQRQRIAVVYSLFLPPPSVAPSMSSYGRLFYLQRLV